MSHAPTAGAMDQRITLQQPGSTVDSLGQRVDGWTVVADMWAQVQPLRGREFIAAEAVQSEVTTRFRIRWRAGVTGAMRVLWNGQAYVLVSDPIDVDGGRHTLELMCRGVAA